MKSIGIIAGIGRLPVVFAKAAKTEGVEVVAIGVVADVDPEMAEVADKYYEIPVTKWGRIQQCLRSEGVKDLYLLGKVNKGIMFSGECDRALQELLAGLPVKNDDAVILAFLEELAKDGITVHKQTDLMGDLLPLEGVMTKRQPDEREKSDIDYGMQVAKAIAGLDIGQTIVVKDGAVLAVEAIEGTDAAIERGAKLCGSGAVVVKVAKPSQDLRFDVPTVGVGTVQAMIAGNAKVLAIEAGKTFLVDREKVLALADQAGIAIIAVKY